MTVRPGGCSTPVPGAGRHPATAPAAPARAAEPVTGAEALVGPYRPGARGLAPAPGKGRGGGHPAAAEAAAPHTSRTRTRARNIRTRTRNTRTAEETRP
ncbi:hypothetical protein ACGFYU_19265 [Streptomyces sp. NPDC048337]|uniref:hypothetical protein n=1 Tax=Streptomyces sp. NPDC048337 TaxID=3365535 RepID=UPI0037186D0D